MGELYHLFFGTSSPSLVFFNLTMMCVGSFLNALAHYKNRKKDGSPEVFEWVYFFKRNQLRIVGGIISVFICLIYMEEIVHYIGDYIPKPLARMTPLLIGGMSDVALILLNIGVKKLKEKINKLIQPG